MNLLKWFLLSEPDEYDGLGFLPENRITRYDSDKIIRLEMRMEGVNKNVKR